MMSDVARKAEGAEKFATAKTMTLASLRFLPILTTLAVVAAAAMFGWEAWRIYMGTPWTRDATVRAYVVGIAPEVAGRIVQLPVSDNEFVHKGDLLMLIDPTSYAIAVRQAKAAVDQAKAVAENAQAEMERREKLTDIAVTPEERQTYVSKAVSAQAAYRVALASLDDARVNFDRTRMRSPVNGYVTNLSAQLGDYATVGQRQISVINADSFWVSAYFEETTLGAIREGDAATIKLMGYRRVLRGTVQSIARGINVPNAQPDASGLASVNPVFTFVRLAQRVPVRIRLDEAPKDVQLVIGMTATVQIEPRQASAAGGSSGARPLRTAANGAAGQGSPATAPKATSRSASEESPQASTSNGAAVAPLSAAPAVQKSSVAAEPPAQPPATTGLPANFSAPESSAPSSPSVKERPRPPAPTAGFAGLEEMPASEYLGRTIDILAGDQGAARPQRQRAPESLRRRAHGKWRRHAD